MSIVFQRSISRMALTMLASAIASGCASAQVRSEAQAEAPEPTVVRSERDARADAEAVTPPMASVQTQPNSTVGELQALIQNRQVDEMRTSYNGTYGASLLFQPETLTYFVALFQQKDFWRVVKTDQHAQAEQLYRRFSDETRALAEEELRGVRLQAEYAYTERQLGQRAAELATLQNDLQTQQRQESVVAARRQQAKAQAEQLAQQQREARQQLQALQRQIRSIEEQQAALGQSRQAKPAQGGKKTLPPK